MTTHWPKVSIQQQWAKEDGFNVWDTKCHACDEEPLPGDDCSQGHYDQWLRNRMGL